MEKIAFYLGRQNLILLGILLVAIAIAATTYLAQQQQELRKRAQEGVFPCTKEEADRGTRTRDCDSGNGCTGKQYTEFDYWDDVDGDQEKGPNDRYFCHWSSCKEPITCPTPTQASGECTPGQPNHISCEIGGRCSNCPTDAGEVRVFRCNADRRWERLDNECRTDHVGCRPFCTPDTPVSTPTLTPTPTPTSSPPPAQPPGIPTTPPTPTPTPTPTPSGTKISLSITLEGFPGTYAPTRDKEPVSVTLKSASTNTSIGPFQGELVYSPSTRRFEATIDLGATQAGNYTVLMKPASYFARNFGIVNIQAGLVTAVPFTPDKTPLSCDLNNDNSVNMEDVNQVYADIRRSRREDTKSSLANINRDSSGVDIFDHNFCVQNYGARGEQL